MTRKRHPQGTRRASATGARAGRRPSAGARRLRGTRSDVRHYRTGAQSRLRRFRQGSMLAVGATGLLLLLLGDPSPAPAATSAASAGPALELVQGQEPATAEAPVEDTVPADQAEAARRATTTLQQLALDFYTLLPAIGIAVALLLLAALLAKLVKVVLTAVLPSWERAQATAALLSIMVWLVALGAALSVLSGDARALVGSIGLFGLALSWALQTPIESFTGWLLNSFRWYYQIGDRIAVGDVFGDVARIDFLTTTVFEAGGPDKRVQAAQSTGAMVTFPNLEVLRSNIVNFTRDFPFVWDEVSIGVANESDLALAVNVLQKTAYRVVGEQMESAATEYAHLLERARLAWDVATRPEVFVSAQESWTDLTIRYVSPAREMRRWSSRLLLAINEALAEPDVAARVFPAYPRRQFQTLPPPPWAGDRGTGAHEPLPRDAG